MELKQRQPDATLLLLEKESRLAQHQTGHNSGVIHAGVYYTPGSRKAAFCRAGVEATMRFCSENNVRHEQCGKMIVATDEAELERMLALYERGQENGSDLELLSSAQLQEREPNIRGVGAIFASTTGIVDYIGMCNKMGEQIRKLGGEVWLETQVSELRELEQYVSVECANGKTVHASYVIACTGLQADRTASMMGIPIDFRIVPYRGEYFQLPESMNSIVNHLIYPVPNPSLPFLGVHLTRMIDGSVTVGPNAVQGWKREGYGRVNVSVGDIANMMSFPGFWRATYANLGPGLDELWTSIWRRGYLKRVQKYCPTIKLDDLKPYPAGVRAMAVLRDGDLVEDFLFADSKRSLHVCSAPSPAATAAIPIGEFIVEKVLARN